MAEHDDKAFKAFARLGIKSKSLGPAEITQRLGVEPSHRHALGV